MSHIPETYYPVVDFGAIGRESVIDWDDCSKEKVILGVMHGEYGGDVIEVHCIDRNDGTWRNVSEDIAREILNRLDEPPLQFLLDYLERHLGCEVMANFAREMA